VVPSLFGYTEEARRAKRSVTVQTVSERGIWNQERFFNELRNSVGLSEAAAVTRVYEWVESVGLKIAWGAGKTLGSFKVRNTTDNASCFAVYTNGELSIPFGSNNAKPEAQPIAAILKSSLDRAGLLPDDWSNRWVNLKPSQWTPHVDALLESWKALATL
jgi:hypothetical protein